VHCIAVDDTAKACRDADIIVEATRLEKPEILIPADAVKAGALIVTYGWMMAVDPELPFRMDKLVVDDWAQCRHGGALYPLIQSGRLTGDHIHAEIGEIVCGAKSGRERDDERILFWHRGFAISDIVLGDAIHRRAQQQGVGTMLPLLEAQEELSARREPRKRHRRLARPPMIFWIPPLQRLSLAGNLQAHWQLTSMRGTGCHYD